VSKTLAYFDTAIITTIKGFKVQAQGVHIGKISFNKLLGGVLYLENEVKEKKRPL